jgi:hypothetical protein
MRILTVLLGWISLSIPVALLIATLFALGARREARLRTPDGGLQPEMLQAPPGADGADEAADLA